MPYNTDSLNKRMICDGKKMVRNDIGTVPNGTYVFFRMIKRISAFIQIILLPKDKKIAKESIQWVSMDIGCCILCVATAHTSESNKLKIKLFPCMQHTSSISDAYDNFQLLIFARSTDMGGYMFLYNY